MGTFKGRVRNLVFTIIASLNAVRYVTSRLQISNPYSAYARWVDPAKPEIVRAVGTRYLERLAHVNLTPRLVDKTLHNTYLLGVLKLAFPRATVVHVCRHPVDNCFGIYRQVFASDALSYAYDLSDIVFHYRLYRRLMDHWEAVLPGGVFTLSYEDLVAEQERQTRRLLDYCGLSWEEACLEPQKAERTVRTASATQVRKGVYTDAVGRWRKYSDHLGPLLDLVDRPA